MEREREGGKDIPCPSMPVSTASSSSDSDGYLNVLRKRCVAAISASLSFSIRAFVLLVNVSECVLCSEVVAVCQVPNRSKGVSLGELFIIYSE